MFELLGYSVPLELAFEGAWYDEVFLFLEDEGVFEVGLTKFQFQCRSVELGVL